MKFRCFVEDKMNIINKNYDISQLKTITKKQFQPIIIKICCKNKQTDVKNSKQVIKRFEGGTSLKINDDADPNVEIQDGACLFTL